jgi:aryl-alcohol dehydrogenase-like predicted oxidoreductase
MKLVLGTVQMGLTYGVHNKTGKITPSDSIEILEYAFEHGIRVLDTAEAYGSAHQVIGQYHKLHPSHCFEIITKVPKQINAKFLESKIQQYLDELQVPNIHLLMYHDFDTYVMNQGFENNISIIKDLNAIDKVGVSVYTNVQILKLLNEINRVDVIQLPYNLLDNKFQRGDVLECMRKEGVVTHTRSPFLQGLFFMEEQSQNKVYQSLKIHIDELKSIAKSSQLSLYELALQYSFFNPLSDGVIIGVDSLEHLKLNLKAIPKQLITHDTIGRIDKIAVENPDLLNPSLWN